MNVHVQCILWFPLTADVEKVAGCDRKFELIFRCMKQGVDAAIQVLQSDADSKRSNKSCFKNLLFLSKLHTNSFQRIRNAGQHLIKCVLI